MLATARYFLDLLAGEEEGLELSGLRAVQTEAAKSLADMARDAVHGFPPAIGRQDMAIEVRDEIGPLMQVKFTFEVESLGP